MLFKEFQIAKKNKQEYRVTVNICRERELTYENVAINPQSKCAVYRYRDDKIERFGNLPSKRVHCTSTFSLLRKGKRSEMNIE
jgi:hypothetical protein